MADYTCTAASVLASATAQKGAGTAGGTITAGQTLYLKASDGCLYPADSNDSTKVPVVGLALNGAGAGQPVSYAWYDPDFTTGLATHAAGDVLVASATAGAICPAADITSGYYPIVVGVATSATKAVIRIVNGTVAKA